MKYYYKDKEGNYYSYKSEHNDECLIPITEEEFTNHVNSQTPVMSEEEIKRQQELAECKSKLAELDYIGIKIATGRATKEEYATEIAEMEKLSKRIRELQK